MKEDFRKILVQFEDRSKLIIKIPASWKITFGELHPGSKYESGATALLIYESETKQRAVYTRVQSFRDLSIETKRLVTDAGIKKEYLKTKNKEHDQKTVNSFQYWVDDNEEFKDVR